MRKQQPVQRLYHYLYMRCKMLQELGTTALKVVQTLKSKCAAAMLIFGPLVLCLGVEAVSSSTHDQKVFTSECDFILHLVCCQLRLSARSLAAAPDCSCERQGRCRACLSLDCHMVERCSR